MAEDETGPNVDRRGLLSTAILTYAMAGGLAAGPASAAEGEIQRRDGAGPVLPTLQDAKASRLSPDVQSLIVLRHDEQTPFAPATYVRSAKEPAHQGKLRTSDGAWWELAEQCVSPYTFGARGEPADDTGPIQAALDYLVAKEGGQLFIPGGRFRFSRDIRVMGPRITICGVGAASWLCGVNNARLIIGEANLLPGDYKSGTKVIATTISSVRISPDSNHQGECLLLDFADNTTVEDTVIGPPKLDGSTVAHGIKTNWVQYTQFRNISINVNGYGIYIVLPKSMTENEDHFSIYSSWIYCGKRRNKNFSPACVAIERQPGRHAAIFQLALYSCHLGAFMAERGDRLYTAGIKCISQEPVDARLLHAAYLVNCMFEYVGTGVDLKSAVHGDTSRFILSSCSFLRQEICFLGRQSKSTITSIGNYFLQCGMVVDGPRVSFLGVNAHNGIKKFSAQKLSYHSFADKYSGGSLEQVCLARKGRETVEAHASHIVVDCALDEEPSAFRITPTWDTTWWLEDVSNEQFTVHFGSPPKKRATLYWDVEV